MFTQCQAIHARALLPCQDSPGVKAPYTASLTVPDGLVGLMSAISTDFPAAAGDGSPRTFKFEQTVPMATYLIAIAAGNLEKRDVGPVSSHDSLTCAMSLSGFGYIRVVHSRSRWSSMLVLVLHSNPVSTV